MNIRVDVDGVGRVVALLYTMADRTKAMPGVYQAIGSRVVRDARMLAPFQTGALARSIRARAGDSSVRVSAGGSSRRKHGGGVYAPIAHNGYYTHSAKGPRPYLSTAAQMNEGYAREQVEDALKRIIKTLGLG